MKRRVLLAAAVFCLSLVAVAPGLGAGTVVKPPPTPPPANFFGIAPMTELTPRDAEYMAAGGIDSVRVPVIWSQIQPTPRGGYDWSSTDKTVATAARAGLQVLPFVYGTPHWLAGKETTLPVLNARQREGWTEFVKAAVNRYGPGGEFWKIHRKEVLYEPPVPVRPIRTWQIWNEANFFYFAYPVSPGRYAELLKLTTPAIKGIDPKAKVILTGLFGRPTAGGLKGMEANLFLKALLRVPGVTRLFDGISLHPYAAQLYNLEEIVEEFHEVTEEAGVRLPLYVTEMGWGSQNDYHQVAFEQGIQGQVRQLRNSYGYLLANARRLDLKQVYWFSWKDVPESCNFCDSTGLFHEGPKFRAKPAWNAFVRITGGTPRP